MHYTHKDPKCCSTKISKCKDPTHCIIRSNPHIFLSTPHKLSGRSPVHARWHSLVLCKLSQGLRILACLEQNFKSPSRFVHVANDFGLAKWVRCFVCLELHVHVEDLHPVLRAFHCNDYGSFRSGERLTIAAFA